MVLVHVDTVVMLTTGHTATSWMLSVLSNTTVTSRNVASLLAVLMFSGRLDIHNEGETRTFKRYYRIKISI